MCKILHQKIFKNMWSSNHQSACFLHHFAFCLGHNSGTLRENESFSTHHRKPFWSQNGKYSISMIPQNTCIECMISIENCSIYWGPRHFWHYTIGYVISVRLDKSRFIKNKFTWNPVYHRWINRTKNFVRSKIFTI